MKINTILLDILSFYGGGGGGGVLTPLQTMDLYELCIHVWVIQL